MVLHCHALNNYDVIKCSDYGAGGSFAHDTNLTFSAVNLEVLQTDMSKELKRIFSSLCCDKLTLNSSMINMLTAENRSITREYFIAYEWWNITKDCNVLA